MSLYKREGSPFWQYDFQRGGVRYKGSTRTADRRRAQQVERRLQKSAELGEIKTTGNATVQDMLDKYYDDHACHMPSVETLVFYIQALEERIPNSLELSELSNAHISEYVAARRQQVSNATVNRELATLRAAHRMAGEDWEWATHAIAWRRHMLKEPQGRTRWITQDEASRLLGALPDHIADAAEWSLLTGCRKAETFDLDWNRVDLTARTAHVLGKGSKWRDVHLSAQAFMLLANMEGDREGKVFSSRNLRKEWAAACRATGIEDFRWHDLRHTFATWLRQSGAALEIVKEALGHHDIGTTMRYAHVARQEVVDAVEKVRVAR